MNVVEFVVTISLFNTHFYIFGFKRSTKLKYLSLNIVRDYTNNVTYHDELRFLYQKW